MITFVAQLSSIVALPVVAVIVWQRRTGAAWKTLLFVLFAFAVYNTARIPIREQVTPYLYYLAGQELWGIIPFIFSGVPTYLTFQPPMYLVLQPLFYGLLRESVRWLTFRYVAKSVQFWQEGVLFGIGYSCLAAVLLIWVSPYGVPEGDPPSFVARAMMLKDDYNWIRAVLEAWRYGVTDVIFNAGTSLAVLYSVRRRKVWFLLAAALLHILPPVAHFVSISHVPPVKLLLPWRSYFITLWFEFMGIVAVLPALWLIFHLRKPLSAKRLPNQ